MTSSEDSSKVGPSSLEIRSDENDSPPRYDEKSLCCALLALVVAGCGGGGGGGSTTDSTSSTTGNDSDDTDDQPTGDENLPPLLDNDCGEVLGYRTECYQDVAFILWSPINNETIAQTISGILPGGNGNPFQYACCEGLAPEAEAGAACAVRCQRLACEAARSNHLDLAEQAAGFLNDCADFASANPQCGFDMDACLTGTWHEQTIDLLFGNPTYFMRAGCGGADTNEVYLNGTFDWNQTPPIPGKNPPPMCDDRPSAETVPGNVNPDDIAVEDAGMTAAVTWTLAGGSSGFVVARGCARKRSLLREPYARHGTLCTDPRRHRSLACDERSYGIGGESYIDRDRLRPRCEHPMPEMQ